MISIQCRKSLFAMVAKNRLSVLAPTEATSSSRHVNYRFLSTPEKVKRLRGLSRKTRIHREKVRWLELKLDKVLAISIVSLDKEMSQDIQKIMDEEESSIHAKLPEDSFQAIFWKHQKESLSKQENRRMVIGGIR